MEILNKLPLTISATALFAVYSLIKSSKNRQITASATASSLPLDMQHEIIRHCFTSPSNFTDSELLNLSMACRSWHQIISQHPSWLKERLRHQRKYNLTNTEKETKNDLVGADAVLSPKLAYFTVLRRNPKPRNTARHTLMKFPEGAEHYKADQLYVPWLNHNLIRSPNTFWKFIKTLLVAPEWLYPFIVWSVDNSRTKRYDERNKRRLILLAGVFFLLFSFLPFLDCLLFRSDGLIHQAKAAFASENIIQHLLWHRKPLEITTFIRASLNLLMTQFLEVALSIDDGALLILRLGSMALLALLSVGPVFQQLVMVGIALILALLFRYIKSKDVRFVLFVCYMVPWLLYLAPRQILFMIVALGLSLFDLLSRANAKKYENFKQARIRLLVVFAVLVSNLK